MKRGIFISLALAAILSVVSIPVVVFLVSNHSEAWTIAGAIIVAVVALVSFSFATATYQGNSMYYWRKPIRWAADPLYPSTLLLLILLIPINIAYVSFQGARALIRSGSAIRAAEVSPETLVLQELNAIEREAQALLGEEPNSSIIRLRSRLQEVGVWSDTDVHDFDVALRTRNMVAHGDQAELSKSVVIEAVETMRRLRRKVEVGQLREGT